MRVSAFRQQSRVSCFDGHFYFIMSKQDEVNRMRNTVSRKNRNGFKSTLMHVFLKAGQIFIALVHVHVFYLCSVLQIYMTINRWGQGKNEYVSKHGSCCRYFLIPLAFFFSFHRTAELALGSECVFCLFSTEKKKNK